MKIYKEYGVSPLGGCLPMIIQMPIWYALFRFFPASISFRQESFLWAQDLSSYDDFFHLPFSIPFVGDHLSLFTILYSISNCGISQWHCRHGADVAGSALKFSVDSWVGLSLGRQGLIHCLLACKRMKRNHVCSRCSFRILSILCRMCMLDRIYFGSGHIGSDSQVGLSSPRQQCWMRFVASAVWRCQPCWMLCPWTPEAVRQFILASKACGQER